MIKKVIFKIILVFSLLLIFTGCDDITEPEIQEDDTDFPVYGDPVWQDEFNDTTSVSLDSSKWGYDLGYGSDGWGNDEWQQYTSNQENVRVENGNLIISAVWDSVNYSAPGKRDGSITSARINTKDKFSFKYGKIQAKIKIPTGSGMWPAFWMLGDNFDGAGWPYCGEIDIMEASPLYYDEYTTLSTLHWWDDEGGYHASQGDHISLGTPLSDDYHIYEVEWDDQRINGKIDGMTYFTKLIDPELMNEFMREFFIIFNVAVGGNLGGTPDATTQWPEQMFVDWVRVYQAESTEDVITSYGLFTDETPVDAGITVGLNAEIYVWENTLTAGSIAPYEGDNVISWATTGVGWFGGGISSNVPEDLSGFEEGNLKFMMKIPADVTFKIGINDISGNENYVTFPANQTVYNLARNGEWGQAVIPVSELKGNVDLSLLSYEFIILEENGTQCEFAIDDIYYDGGGEALVSSINFDYSTYAPDASTAAIQLVDEGAANTQVSVMVSNGTDEINIDILLDDNGTGTGSINFGMTNDDTDTIEINAGGSLAASYTNSEGVLLTASADIEGGSSGNAMAIFSETHSEEVLSYSQIVNSADWSGNSAVPDDQSTSVSPLEGNYVLEVEYQTGSMGWGGIAFDFGSQDASAYNTFIININSSALAGFSRLGIKFEDSAGGQTELNIADLAGTVNGDWMQYEIPLSSFNAVNFADVKYLGLWSPQDSGGNLLFGMLYFDDIYLTNR